MIHVSITWTLGQPKHANHNNVQYGKVLNSLSMGNLYRMQQTIQQHVVYMYSVQETGVCGLYRHIINPLVTINLI